MENITLESASKGKKETWFTRLCCKWGIHSFSMFQEWENGVNPRFYCLWCKGEMLGVYGYQKSLHDV